MKGIVSRSAFTMIELIFVIIILGILGAVSLPKFLGVKKQADDMKVVAFAGTLTRTVGPTLWSDSIHSGHNGNITFDPDPTMYDGETLSFYIDHYPRMLDETSVNFDNCVAESETASPFIAHRSGFDYNVFCKNGNDSNPPQFVASKDGTYDF